MITLLELYDSDVFPGAENLDPTNFSHRRAARAVLMDDVRRVVLMHVGQLHFHKLPGGGVEEYEEIEQALQRELFEETGCHAEIVKKIGEVVEFKSQQRSKQTSYCWLARFVGKAEAPTYTDKEIREGFEVVWANNIDNAIELLDRDRPIDYTGSFIRVRDLKFLEAAKSLL